MSGTSAHGMDGQSMLPRKLCGKGPFPVGLSILTFKLLTEFLSVFDKAKMILRRGVRNMIPG